MTSKAEPDHIASREDLVSFIRLLNQDLQTDPFQWENIDLARFLDAMASWIEDMDGFFLSSDERVPTRPTWKLFAQILAAAAVYE